MPKKKKRRIMSIDELYEFCLKNNFAHFALLKVNFDFPENSGNSKLSLL